MEQNIEDIREKVNTLRENKYLCDVTLVVEEKRFPCHRLVLALNSSYFYAMFENFKEKTSDEITLKGLSSIAFEDILKYIYVNEVNINNDNVKDLLMASEMLGIETLQESCLRFIGHVGVNDLVDLFIYVQLHNNSKLVEKLKGFICENFSDICDSGSVVHLSYEQLKLILESEDLTAEKEETVLDGVLKWIKFDEESRLKYMEELISIIKVPSLMSEYMINLLLNEPIIQIDKKYQDIVVKRSCSSLCKTYKKPKKEFCEPRFMLFSRKFPEDSKVVPEVFQENQIVQNFDQLSFETSYLRSVVLNKNTLLVLWKNKKGKLEFQKIDLDSCEYINLKPPPVFADDYSLQAGGSGICLYVQSSRDNLSTRFWFYDLTLDIWTGIPDLIIDGYQVNHSCFKVHKNELYCIGGVTDSWTDTDNTENSLKTVYSLDIRGDAWENLRSMKSCKTNVSACFLHENLWVCGRNCSNSNLDTEIFDPCNHTWMSARCCNSPSSVFPMHSMFSANNKLYLIGCTPENFGSVRKPSISISNSINRDNTLRIMNDPITSWYGKHETVAEWEDDVMIDRAEIIDAILLDC